MKSVKIRLNEKLSKIDTKLIVVVNEILCKFSFFNRQKVESASDNHNIKLN